MLFIVELAIAEQARVRINERSVTYDRTSPGPITIVRSLRKMDVSGFESLTPWD